MKKWLMVGLLLSPMAIAQSPLPAMQLLEQRVNLLQLGLQPKDADTLVDVFANAVLQRNGAVQYALYCKGLRASNLAGFQQMNWVTGVSSPSVDSYSIDKGIDGKYVITYKLVAGGKEVGAMTDMLQVQEEPSETGKMRFCINSYSNK